MGGKVEIRWGYTNPRWTNMGNKSSAVVGGYVRYAVCIMRWLSFVLSCAKPTLVRLMELGGGRKWLVGAAERVLQSTFVALKGRVLDLTFGGRGRPVTKGVVSGVASTWLVRALGTEDVEAAAGSKRPRGAGQGVGIWFGPNPILLWSPLEQFPTVFRPAQMCATMHNFQEQRDGDRTRYLV